MREPISFLDVAASLTNTERLLEIHRLYKELAAAQANLAERDESFERLFQKAMAHDRDVAELQEKLAAYGNYTPVAYEEVHKFYTEWPGGLDEIESALNGWRREAGQAKAKLARYEAAGREMPEEPQQPNFNRSNMPDDVAAYINKLRTFAIAQQVRADENERDAHKRGWDLALLKAKQACEKLNSVKCVVAVCSLDYEAVLAAIDAASKERS